MPNSLTGPGQPIRHRRVNGHRSNPHPFNLAPTGRAGMSDRLGALLVVVTGVVWAALRCWPLHGCADCVVPV